jgi:hypothetical protein
MVVKANLVHCARKCARQLSGNILKIRRRHDMVTVEDITSFMPRHLRGDSCRHTHINHIPDCGPPEVMPQHAKATSLHTRGLPGSFKILDTLALVRAS